MSLPLYAKISIGIISVVLIATVGLVVLTIMGKKPKTMKEWMTSDEGVNTLTQALSNLDSSKTFGFNITGNATTADKATSATNLSGNHRIKFLGPGGNVYLTNYSGSQNNMKSKQYKPNPMGVSDNNVWIPWQTVTLDSTDSSTVSSTLDLTVPSTQVPTVSSTQVPTVPSTVAPIF